MTTDSTHLGRLEKIEPRTVWSSEAQDFTPWLAREQNIALLGDTIGVDLEVEATERDVGPFRADILCKDTGTGAWVLIENQLERTDHTHLGQLMTYAAGLKAVTIVWIAQRFTDEHRAAMDWLNEITPDVFNFFGLEIELWRIGTSPVAPKFNMVAKPNDWARAMGGAAGRMSEGAMSDTRQLQLEYWTTLREFLLDRQGVLKSQAPRPQHWTSFSIGRSYFSLAALVNTQDQVVTAQLFMGGPEASAHCRLLMLQRAEIESEIGSELQWELMPNKKTSKVMLETAADPTDRTDWPRQHAWLADQLERFHRAFSGRVKALDASEAVDLDEEGVPAP